MVDHVIDTQPFPLYYAASKQFLGPDGTPSGQAGAVARLTVEVNNRPQTITSIRFWNSYDISQNTLVGQDPLNYLALRLGGIDDEQTVEINITAQNITFPEVHQATFQGAYKINFHPLACGYQLRGANKIQITVRRVAGYPFFNQEIEQILPTVHVAIVSVLHMNDLQEGSAPASYRPRG